MAVLDFVLNWHFGVGLVVGWLVVPHLKNFVMKFLKK